MLGMVGKPGTVNWAFFIAVSAEGREGSGFASGAGSG